jgi:hypothetical protein
MTILQLGKTLLQLGASLEYFSLADLTLPISPHRNSPAHRRLGLDPITGNWLLSMFGTETPCDGLSPNDRIMFFAAAIGGRLNGKEQT